MAGENEQVLRQEEAKTYLENHKILQLFNNMTSMLVYDRPDNPRQYLIEQLEKLQKAKETQLDFPCLFDDTNIKSIFGMLDPTQKGYITYSQYKEALQTIGVKDFDINPPGADVDKITMDTFLKEAKLGLMHSSATYNG